MHHKTIICLFPVSIGRQQSEICLHLLALTSSVGLENMQVNFLHGWAPNRCQRALLQRSALHSINKSFSHTCCIRMAYSGVNSYVSYLCQQAGWMYVM